MNAVKKYLSQIKIFLPAIIVAFFMLLSITDTALAAFNAEAQARNVLKFIALIILIAAAVGALTMLVRGLIVQAILLFIGAGLLYFLVANPDVVQDIGNGLSNLLFGGSGGE